jgi:hypothetical protein
MRPFTRGALILGALAFFAVQLACTLRNQNAWPFCTYNMFSRLAPLDMDTLIAQLRLANGETREVNAWEVIPLEFFRAINLVQRVYLRDTSRAVRDGLAGFLVRALNTHPQRNFDQTYAAPELSAPVVGLSLLRRRLDLRDPENPRVQEEQLLYVYRAPLLAHEEAPRP